MLLNRQRISLVVGYLVFVVQRLEVVLLEPLRADQLKVLLDVAVVQVDLLLFLNELEQVVQISLKLCLPLSEVADFLNG